MEPGSNNRSTLVLRPTFSSWVMYFIFSLPFIIILFLAPTTYLEKILISLFPFLSLLNLLSKKIKIDEKYLYISKIFSRHKIPLSEIETTKIESGYYKKATDRLLPLIRLVIKTKSDKKIIIGIKEFSLKELPELMKHLK
jgi:hypothetical protein